MPRRAFVLLAPALVVGAIVWQAAFDLRRPVDGIVVGILVAALIATGFLLPPLLSLGFAVLIVVVPVLIAGEGWVDEPTVEPGVVCDPSCGIGSPSVLLIALPVVLAITCLGIIGRAAVDHRQRRRGTRTARPD